LAFETSKNCDLSLGFQQLGRVKEWRGVSDVKDDKRERYLGPAGPLCGTHFLTGSYSLEGPERLVVVVFVIVA